MSFNRKILKKLIEAPDSQMSKEWRQICRDFNGSDDELKALFKRIYEEGCCGISSFIKQVVNPEFTSKY